MNRLNFDINYFTNKNIALQCTTKEKAKDLLNFLHNKGFTWYGGDSLLEKLHWSSYKGRTCYDINVNTKTVHYSHLDFYEETLVSKIIQWELVEEEKVYTTSEIISMLEKDKTLEFKEKHIREHNNYLFNNVKLDKDNMLCWGGDSRYPLNLVIDDNYNKWTLVNKEYTIYKVEHSPKGKLYDFISDEELKINSLVNCDTAIGNSYGIIREIVKRRLTKKELIKYRKCYEVF